MNILALEPYFGGSHEAFLAGWIDNSSHNFTLLTLPGNKWKWRMRSAAVEFADKLRELEGHNFDLFFASDMLNLAEFKGLCPPSLAGIPTVVYFHENQLTYPNRFESERDYQFVLTNTTSALAADAVWFNSAFHRDEFIGALKKFIKRMPGNELSDTTAKIAAKSSIHPPGIDPLPLKGKRQPGPVRILWAARWEHDKNPEDFFAAMKILKQKGIDFRLNVVGEQFKDSPDIFNTAEVDLADHIDRWGFQSDRKEYINALADSDVIVSTANHEFFGISVIEAIAAGAYPLLPKRLSYPQIIGNIDTDSPEDFFYDGSVSDLAEKLIHLAKHTQNDTLWQNKQNIGIDGMKKFHWDNIAKTMDAALEELV
jgi:glycosyltransferase involved in cell wall biosynthesis